jgi:hypothetical protein
MGGPERSLDPAAARGPEAHPSAAELAGYIDALGAGTTAALPGETLDHVEHCPQCQGQILDVHFYLRDPLHRPDPAWARSVFPGRKQRRFWLLPPVRIAAASFAFILLTALFFFLPRQPLTDSPGKERNRLSPAPEMAGPALPGAPKKTAEKIAAAGREPSPQTVAKNKAAAGPRTGDAFAVNPNLESMVGSRSRSFMIEVYSPPNHVTLPGEITFAWKEFNREPLDLVIVNNRNETIFKTAAVGGVYHFRASLPPGCYYWKLESASELFYVGKFSVAAAPTSPK